MRKLWIIAAVIAGIFTAVPAQAAITLEFFVGTTLNDGTLSTTAFPNDPVTGLPTVALPTPGSTAFIQVAMHQTGGTPMDASNGLAAFLMQAVYGSGQAGQFVVPATVVGGSGTLPVVDVNGNNPGIYSLVRAYRIGPGGNMNGGNETTATAVRFGGLNLNPPPSPSVDANGRIFLGTLKVQATAASTAVLSDLTFVDPNPAASTVDNITDNGDNLDALLFNGTTYTLPIRVGPVPEPSSFVLAGLVASGAIGLRLRRKKNKTEVTEPTTAA